MTFEKSWEILKRRSTEDRLEDIHREMLRNNQRNLMGYDPSGLSYQDNVLLHNEKVLGYPDNLTGLSFPLDSNRRPLPPMSYVPVRHIEESDDVLPLRSEGNKAYRLAYNDNPRMLMSGHGERFSIPHFARHGEFVRQPQFGDLTPLDFKESKKRHDEMKEALAEQGWTKPYQRQAVKNSATDPLGIDKASTSCDCDSCNLLAKAVIGREKNPSPDAKAGKTVCGTCNGKGKTPKCETCGFQSTPYGTMRATKPSQWKNRPFKKGDSLLVEALLKAKDKPFHGYNPNRHSRKGGLNAKGRAKFKRETGANLKPPVSTPPSKLKSGSKKAKRRKSFCARMGGVKGPTSKGGKLTPKGAALKRWNC